MSTVESLLSAHLSAAFSTLTGVMSDPQVHRSAHADFQSNAALALAPALGLSPREVATAVVAAADLSDVATASVSGPGFINLTLLPPALNRLLGAMAADPRLGVPLVSAPETVVIDYSGPNVAKEMHVGHLRSTIIGDCLLRVLRFTGHNVIPVSHIGDWGTPFGMLLERLVEIGEDSGSLSIGDLDAFYKAARHRFDTDPDFADRSRQRVVLLQGGDPETLRLWKLLTSESARYFMAVNARLSVLLTPSDFVGESFYNDQLASVVSELDTKGLLQRSSGAQCVFPPGFTGRDGEPFPLIVRKSDGGFGYAATDLAAIRHRALVLGGQRVLYVLGTPQSQHLEMVFAVARQMGWLDGVAVKHVGFGSILGEDGKMLKSRRGKSVKLIDLLDEAVARAGEVNPSTATAVGIGAVKYADLSSAMVKDYVFDLERMLSLHGNTSVYLQYTHARALRVIHRAGTSPRSSDLAIADGQPGIGSPDAIASGLRIETPQERALALALLAFPGAVQAVATELEPHRLAGLLRDVAVAFTRFYEDCPVLNAEPGIRESRLVLCDLTARVLAQGLYLLGIEAPERM